MKKVFNYILTFVFIFAFGVGLVEAEKITLEDVANKIDEIIKEENTSDILFDVEYTTKNLTISSNDGFFIKFDYANGVLSTKHSLDDFSMAMRYSGTLALVTQAVVLLNGYTLEEWQLSNNIKTAKLETNGYEYHPNENYEMEYFVNINEINLDNISDKENMNDVIDKDEEEITFVEPKAKPESIVIKDIAEKLPSVLKKLYIEQFGELVEDSSNFSVEYDYNTLTIFQEIDKKKETLRTLTINDGVISHEYIYDTELGIDGERIVNVFIYKSIFMTIGEIYGYSEKELEFLYKDFFEGVFDEKGYEFVSTKEKSTFKIDMNRFNLEKISDDEVVEDIEINNNTNNNERNSGNPIVFVIMIIIVILALCLLFYINRDMFGNMLRNKYRR